jgi:hypothetical protein
MTMHNPWDIPPFPIRGDDVQDTTFAGVGRVLTQWEMIEVELAQVYGWLVKRPDDIEALHQYGMPQIFEKRIKGLSDVADVYFRWNAHQDAEGEFRSLSTKVRNFSARRNDVAHSIVQPFQWIVSPELNGPLQFCAVPPHYAGKKFDPQNMPRFIYTSVELTALSNALFYVAEGAKQFKWKLILGEDGVPPEGS